MREYDIWVIVDGSAVLTCVNPPTRTFTLQRGSVVLFRPGSLCMLHQVQEAERLALNYFHFEVEGPDGTTGIRPDDLEGFPMVIECQDADFLESLCTRIHRLAIGWDGRDVPGNPWAHRHAGCLLKMLLLDAHYQCVSRSQQIEIGINDFRYRQVLAVIELIRKNPTHFSTVRDIARFCHISPDYVTKLFLRACRAKPSDFLIQARIDRAKLYLAGSSLTVGEIAEELGYKNLYFFSRQFKLKTGLTPSRFRREKSGIGHSGGIQQGVVRQPKGSGTPKRRREQGRQMKRRGGASPV